MPSNLAGRDFPIAIVRNMNNDQSGYSVDVVVIGGGFAGLAAGIEARLAGASVFLVEKMARSGGNSIISNGGMNAGGSSMKKAQGMMLSRKTDLRGTA